jgi:hypothetical protein
LHVDLDGNEWFVFEPSSFRRFHRGSGSAEKNNDNQNSDNDSSSSSSSSPSSAALLSQELYMEHVYYITKQKGLIDLPQGDTLQLLTKLSSQLEFDLNNREYIEKVYQSLLCPERRVAVLSSFSTPNVVSSSPSTSSSSSPSFSSSSIFYNNVYSTFDTVIAQMRAMDLAWVIVLRSWFVCQVGPTNKK